MCCWRYKKYLIGVIYDSVVVIGLFFFYCIVLKWYCFFVSVYLYFMFYLLFIICNLGVDVLGKWYIYKYDGCNCCVGNCLYLGDLLIFKVGGVVNGFIRRIFYSYYNVGKDYVNFGLGFGCNVIF